MNWKSQKIFPNLKALWLSTTDTLAIKMLESYNQNQSQIQILKLNLGAWYNYIEETKNRENNRDMFEKYFINLTHLTLSCYISDVETIISPLPQIPSKIKSLYILGKALPFVYICKYSMIEDLRVICENIKEINLFLQIFNKLKYLKILYLIKLNQFNETDVLPDYETNVNKTNTHKNLNKICIVSQAMTDETKEMYKKIFKNNKIEFIDIKSYNLEMRFNDWVERDGIVYKELQSHRNTSISLQAFNFFMI